MSKKDYKQGMADAMSAYEDFGKKQEAAAQHIGEQIRKTADKVDRLEEKIDDIADYITDQEKAALYKLNTPVDIADLEEPEKRILLAVLYQLTADEEGVTEEQRNYVRAIQRYLEIHNPQTEIDLTVVEKIEDISAQKAVLQAVMEFFRLGANPEEAQEKYRDFLDCFQLNEKSRREIVERIEAIINVVGYQGLSEKYGFVPEPPSLDPIANETTGAISETAAESFLAIAKDIVGWGAWDNPNTFQNSKFFLETTDYMVFCRKNYNASWKNLEGRKELREYGLFCVDKQSGEISRIDIDYAEDFPFKCAQQLAFYIQENTVYFMENWDRSKDRPAHSQLVAIDFSTRQFQKLPVILEHQGDFSVGWFHLSGSGTQLLISFFGATSSKWQSQILMVDLAQNFQTCLLEPNMLVRDALLQDGNILLLGKADDDSRISVFHYNAATEETTDLFPEAGTLFNRYQYSEFKINENDSDEKIEDWISEGMSSENFILGRVWRSNGAAYFLLGYQSDASDCTISWNCKILNEEGSGHLGGHKKSGHIFPTHENDDLFIPCVDSWEILLNNDDCILAAQSNKVGRYDFATKTFHWVDEGGRPYILTGNFLYKRMTRYWYKTNISYGTNDLQWVPVKLPGEDGCPPPYEQLMEKPVRKEERKRNKKSKLKWKWK